MPVEADGAVETNGESVLAERIGNTVETNGDPVGKNGEREPEPVCSGVSVRHETSLVGQLDRFFSY